MRNEEASGSGRVENGRSSGGATTLRMLSVNSRAGRFIFGQHVPLMGSQNVANIRGGYDCGNKIGNIGTYICTIRWRWYAMNN